VAVALGLGRGEDDRGAVLGRALRLAAEGTGLALLVDDAGALPPATRAELIAACNTTGFSLVLAFDSADHPQLANLPAHVRRVDLGPPMTLGETRAYVHARLRRVDPDGAFAARQPAALGRATRRRRRAHAVACPPRRGCATRTRSPSSSACRPRCDRAEPAETETIAPVEQTARRPAKPRVAAQLERPGNQIAPRRCSRC
jgi:hypothetical protein